MSIPFFFSWCLRLWWWSVVRRKSCGRREVPSVVGLTSPLSTFPAALCGQTQHFVLTPIPSLPQCAEEEEEGRKKPWSAFTSFSRVPKSSMAVVTGQVPFSLATFLLIKGLLTVFFYRLNLIFWMFWYGVWIMVGGVFKLKIDFQFCSQGFQVATLHKTMTGGGLDVNSIYHR